MVKAITEHYDYYQSCWWCKSILLYNEEDIEINYNTHEKYIICPICLKKGLI